jgi:hypothetical protein
VSPRGIALYWDGRSIALSGPAALDWLSAGPQAAYAGADRSAWLQAPDGSL